MTSKRDKNREILIEIYQYSSDEVAKLSDEEVANEISHMQDKDLQKAKNPNAFWMIKGMPTPKIIKTKTKASAGIWVFIAFIFVFVLFFILMMILAFKANG
ncbi:hypothetical protein ACW95P_03515 [Candidatus Mycoplasma pogonae]